MDNYQITKTEFITYLSDSKNIEIDEKVELWMNSNDKNNISLAEIIDMIWKIII
jgi:hypothetical protein